MRYAVTVLPAATLALGIAGAALAGHATPQPGYVQSVDAVNDVVMFTDGTRFKAARDVEVDGLVPGTPVIFYYHDWGNGKVVVSYEFIR